MLAVSGVFNPVTALPGYVQPLAKVLPTTYAFRAMRQLLDGGAIPWDDVAKGYVGAFAFCALGYWFIVRMLNTFRARGYVTRFS
jgi:ABC-2 type transport system permease protein